MQLYLQFRLYDNYDDLAYYFGGKTEEEEFRDELDAYVDDSDRRFELFSRCAYDVFGRFS